MSKAQWVIAAGVSASLFMYVIEQILGVNYFIKTAAKLIVFTSVPVFYIIKIKKMKLKERLSFKSDIRHSLLPAFLFGFLSFAAVLIAFMSLREFIDLAAIADELETKLGITPQVFLYVALYITFINSMLEEFFFRGFLFLELYNLGYRRTGYIASSLLFGLYHIAIFQKWFTLPVTLLALGGLVGVGLLFDWLVSKSGSFISSWIVHVFADIAIVLIGFYMFGMLG